MANQHSEYQALGTLTVLLGISSSLAAGWIMFSAINVLRRNKKTSVGNAPSFLIKQVFWMCACDVIAELYFAFSWLPVALDKGYQKDYSKLGCGSIGVWGQFFLLGSTCWNLIICICLLRILIQYDVSRIDRELPLHHLFVWTVAFIATIIPLIGDAYGYVKNTEEDHDFPRFQCWIEKPDYHLCIFVPAIGSVFAAIVLLILTVLIGYSKKFQKHKVSQLYMNAYRKYTIVFVLTWFFPIVLRLRGIEDKSAPPPILVWLHHIGLTSIGLGNAWVWGSSINFARGGGIPFPQPAPAAVNTPVAGGATGGDSPNNENILLKHNNANDDKSLNIQVNTGGSSITCVDDSTVVVTMSPFHSRVSVFPQSEKEGIALLQRDTTLCRDATSDV